MILTAETNYDVRVEGELASLKYDDVLLNPVTENGVPKFDLLDLETKGRLSFVMTYILARVDDSYK